MADNTNLPRELLFIAATAVAIVLGIMILSWGFGGIPWPKQ